MIKNLQVSLNEAGKIKIGNKGVPKISAQGKEFRLPQKLDHFLLTTTEKNDTGDFILDADLMDRIKESGTGIVNESGNLVGLPVRLLYDDIESNFPTRYACYAGNKLSCYGDGETAHRRIDDYKKPYPCPCDRLDPDYDGDQKCKANGRLTCMIDEAGFFGQAHVFRTTSINSIKGIWGGMELIKVATKGRLAGIPLMLTLSARHTSRGVVYVVSICFNGTMEALRDSVHELAMKEKVYLLETHNKQMIAEPGEDEQDFIEEFYPTEVEAAEAVEPIKAGGVEHDNVSENTDTTNGSGNVDKNENHTAERPQDNEYAEESGDIETQDQSVKSEPGSSQVKIDINPRLLNRGGTYAGLYNRFLVAVNKNEYDNALKLVNRMTKDYLELFFTRERPDVKLKPKFKKPDLIETIKTLLDSPAPMLLKEQPVYHDDDEKDCQDTEEHPLLVEIRAMEDREEIARRLVEFFRPIPVNLTLDRDGLIEWAEDRIGNGDMSAKDRLEQSETQAFNQATDPGKVAPDEDAIDTEPTPESKENDSPTDVAPSDKEAFAYDETSGPVGEEQLRTIVKLKGKLEKSGKLNDGEFFTHVQKFKDAAGDPMTSAVNFSLDQAIVFIDLLSDMLPEKEQIPNIPF